MNHTEVAIAGGGVIGLSVALELAAAGLQVTVFERGRAMQESSWAAAGMLAAGDPENPAALRPLAELSLALYPQFLQRLEELSGIHVPIRTTQTIQGFDAAAGHLPRGTFELDAFSLNTLAPGIETNGLRYFLLEERSLSPRDLARALPLAARAAGISILEECPVLDAHPRGGGLELRAGRGEWTAHRLIYATGAWTQLLTGIPCGPRKGQMVEVELHGEPQLGVVLRTPDIYLVPRGAGRIVIGATVERAGFDKQVDEMAITGLIETAAAVWPPVRHARIVESWAGLRPSAPDDLPVIGEVTSEVAGALAGARGTGSNTWIAAGHFRNGILLAPGTARLVREMVLGEKPSVDRAPFRCDRFVLSSVQ